MTKTRNGKTVNQMLSKARARFQWLDKLQKNAGHLLSRIDGFQLPRNVYDVPKTPNTLTLEYVGENTPEAVLKARQQVERVFETTIGENNVIVAKCKRITLTITLAGLPVVEVKAAA